MMLEIPEKLFHSRYQILLREVYEIDFRERKSSVSSTYSRHPLQLDDMGKS